MLTLDSNNILSIGPILDTGKEYTRTFFGYPITAYDHTVLVYHKKEIIQKQWKELGAGQCILKVKPPVIASETKQSIIEGAFNKGLSRLGFDILYKYDDEKGETINIAKPDTTIIEFANNAFGTSRSALVMPSYDACLHENVLHSFLFGITLAHGKWLIKNDTLLPIKITLPLTSSLLGKKEFFEKMTEALQTFNIIHSVQFVQTGTYEVMQLTLHDPALLSQFIEWLNPIVKISQISTLENTQKVYEILEEYASKHGLELPITSMSELLVLEAD